MLGAVLIASISTASIGFNLRFLFALCKECKPRWICCLLRLQPGTNVQFTSNEEDAEASVARAA
jgi:hypothetical protein